MLYEIAQAGAIVLLIQDEILVSLIPTLTRRWLPKGRQTAKIYCRSLHPKPQEKLAIFGALNVLTGKVHRFLALAIKKEPFLGFIRRITQYYRNQAPDQLICLVIDGHSAHRAQLVTRWLRGQSRIFCYQLPKNSPELSPIEYFWRKLRKEVTHDTVYPDLRQLRQTSIQFFNRWGGKSPRLGAWVQELVGKIWTQDNHIKPFG